MEAIVLECKEKMGKAQNALENNLASVRAGRVSPSIFEDIKVDYYGDKTAISYIATITSVTANVMIIKPFDRNDVKAIVAAINESNLGVNPINEGESVRIAFPTLTEERRRELAKSCHRYGEDSKVAMRNIRRDFNEMVKKDKDLSEDNRKRLENEIQKATDEAIKLIDLSISKKEKEIMEI